MSGELSMKDLDYSFAPQPHNMAVDNAISAEAYRIWGIIHMLKWNRIDPEPESIADLLHVHSRSVRRWLSELDTAQWLKWNRNCADPRKRLLLLTDPHGSEAAILAQIQALFAGGEPTIEQIRTLIMDSLVQSDTIVQSDRNGQTVDPTINDMDRNGQTVDPTINGLDARVQNATNIGLPEASKRQRSEVDGVGGLSFRKKKSPTPSGDRAHLTAVTPTATEVWLRAQGVSKKKARQFAAFDPQATQHEWDETIPIKGSVPEIERQQRIGGLLDRWEVRPPALPPPPAEQQRDDEAERRSEAYRNAHWHAGELLGPGAAFQDMAIVVNALVEGASDAQALAELAKEPTE